MLKLPFLISVGLSCLIFIKNANALPQGFGQAVRSGPKSKPSNTLASSSLKSSLDEACKTLPKTNLTALLVGAARNNLLPQVKCFLDKGVNVDGKLKGYTALTWAAEQGYEKMVDFLISKGANVNARQDSDVNNGATVLMRAAIKGKTNIVRKLVQSKAKVNDKNRFNSTALMQAAASGHKQVVEFLLQNGADVNAADYHNYSSLHKAAQAGHDAIVKLLINNKKTNNIDSKTVEGFTALYRAAQKGHFAVVKTLANKGADIDAITEGGETALMQAAQTDEISMMKFLIQKGADVNKQEFGNNWTPLIWATYSGYPKAVKVLLDNGAKVDLLSKESYTALVYAAKEGLLEIVKILVKKGADVNVQTVNSIAKFKGKTETTTL